MKSPIRLNTRIKVLAFATLLICIATANGAAFAEMPFTDVFGQAESALAKSTGDVCASMGGVKGDNNSPDETNPCSPTVDKALGGTGSNDLVEAPMPQVLNGTGEIGAETPGALENQTYKGRNAPYLKQVGTAMGGKYGAAVGGAMAIMGTTMSAQQSADEARPLQNAMMGQGQAMGAATVAADVAGEIGHDMAQTAIHYVATARENFTVDGSNKWNKIRDQIFVPIGLLLLVPGAVLAQLKAIMAAGNPVLGHVNPFDGILRSLVAIFLIPGTYLICNYGIDLSNSFTYTISSEFTRLFGTDMYKDAICHEFKSMPWRLPEENRNTIDIPVSSMGIVLMGNETPFAQLEATLIAVKIYDPCSGIYLVPPDRANEAVPASCMAARMATNSSNAALCTSWSILCAFQMAYFYYLWCVGPVVAGLWVWPMKQLRDALPAWIEGVIVVCFWSFFWNTVVLLMAAFRGVDETGTFVMLALNTLANISVKFAFDFGGLVRSAGGEAIKLGEKLSKAVQSGGAGGGGGGGGGDCGGGNGGSTTPQEAPGQPGNTSPPQRPNIAMNETNRGANLASAPSKKNNMFDTTMAATVNKHTGPDSPSQYPAVSLTGASGQASSPIKNQSPKTTLPPLELPAGKLPSRSELTVARANYLFAARDAGQSPQSGQTSNMKRIQDMNDQLSAAFPTDAEIMPEAERTSISSTLMNQAASPEKAHNQGGYRTHSQSSGNTESISSKIARYNQMMDSLPACFISASADTPAGSPSSAQHRNQTVAALSRASARPSFINQH